MYRCDISKISFHFSHAVLLNSLWAHATALQASLSITGNCSNSCTLSRWCNPSHPVLSPASPAFILSQHQVVFHWISSSHQGAKVLELQLQHQSFQWAFRTDFLSDGLVGSPSCPTDSQESSTPQFKSINSSVLSFLYSPTFTSIWLLEKP